jgi:hypothetical protein
LVHEHAIELTKYKACMKEFEDGDGGGWQKCEKRKTITPLAITNFFWKGTGYKKGDHAKLKFIEDLVLYITKDYEALSSVESPWFHCLVMCKDNKIQFPSWKQLVEEHIPSMLQKTPICTSYPI